MGAWVVKDKYGDTYGAFADEGEAVDEANRLSLTVVYDSTIAIPERVKCYVCGVDMPYDPYGEACYSCMHPEMPREVGDYTDGYGNDYGWQDSTFPNEY